MKDLQNPAGIKKELFITVHGFVGLLCTFLLSSLRRSPNVSLTVLQVTSFPLEKLLCTNTLIKVTWHLWRPAFLLFSVLKWKVGLTESTVLLNQFCSHVAQGPSLHGWCQKPCTVMF